MSYEQVSTEIAQKYMVPHAPFRFEKVIPSPVPTSEQTPQATQNINKDPNAMWEIFDEESKNNQGWVEPTTPPSLWYAAAVAKPYVNPHEADDITPYPNSHYLLSPRIEDKFATPSNMEVEEVIPATRHIQAFMDNPFAYVSYNIGEDDRNWHAHAQSWANWHIHLEQSSPHDLTAVDKVDVKRKEPGDKIRLEFFRECISRAEGEGHGELLGSLRLATFLGNEEGKAAFGHAPQGLVFTLPEDTSPEHMAAIFKDMDGLYRAFHKNTYQYMVKNYDEVAASQWKSDYDVRTPEELEEQIKANGIEDESVAVKFLRNAHHAVEQSQITPDKEKRVYKSPCYTVSMRRQLRVDENGLVRLGGYAVILDPHSLRRNGGVEARGVNIKRVTSSDVDNSRLMSVINSSHERFLQVDQKAQLELP